MRFWPSQQSIEKNNKYFTHKVVDKDCVNITSPQQNLYVAINTLIHPPSMSRREGKVNLDKSAIFKDYNRHKQTKALA